MREGGSLGPSQDARAKGRGAVRAAAPQKALSDGCPKEGAGGAGPPTTPAPPRRESLQSCRTPATSRGRSAPRAEGPEGVGEAILVAAGHPSGRFFLPPAPRLAARSASSRGQSSARKEPGLSRSALSPKVVSHRCPSFRSLPPRQQRPP